MKTHLRCWTRQGPAQTQLTGPFERRPAVGFGAALCLSLLVVACRNTGDANLGPTPAGPRAVATVAPLAGATSTRPGLVAATSTPEVAAADAGALAFPAMPTRPLGVPVFSTPTALPAVLFDAAEGDSSGSTGRCAVPRAFETWTLAPAADAPADAAARWQSAQFAEMQVEVTGDEAGGRRLTLKAVEPAADHAYVLTSTGGGLPLRVGERYRLAYAQDVPGAPPVGSGLIVSDDAGVLFVGASVRETDGADRQLLGGRRGGFAVRQLASRCEPSATTPCGFALRAAQLEVALGERRVTATAGDQPVDLPGAPAYRITVHASHIRQWVGDIACADPTDWVLSYRIERR